MLSHRSRALRALVRLVASLLLLVVLVYCAAAVFSVTTVPRKYGSFSAESLETPVIEANSRDRSKGVAFTANVVDIHGEAATEEYRVQDVNTSGEVQRGEYTSARNVRGTDTTTAKEILDDVKTNVREIHGYSTASWNSVFGEDTDLTLHPLSVKYYGKPISELYQPGFDIDPTPCTDGGSGIQLVVVVHSSYKNLETRMSIRHTWGSVNLRSDTVVVYFLGRSLDKNSTRKVQEESQTYGDIVVSKNVDTYNNLTLKTIAMSEWLSHRCPKVKFFLKSDDDIFLNVPRLLDFLREPSMSTANRTVYGALFGDIAPVRVKGHRHYISPEEYPAKNYLEFMQGGCYMMTGDLSRELYRASLRAKFFRMEDVFFTGLMAERVGARKVGPPDFFVVNTETNSPNTADDVDSCAVRSKISIHHVYIEQMFRMWESVFDKKLKC